MLAKIIYWLFYFKFGQRNVPPIVLIVSAINIGVFLIPEVMWNNFGIDVMRIWNSLPGFMKYLLVDMKYKNAAYVFWMLLPIAFLINSVALTVVYNITDFKTYLKRRGAILEKNGKDVRAMRLDLVAGGLIIIALYIWKAFIYHSEPAILGGFTPNANRLALIMFYGLPALYLFPLLVTLFVAEARAVLSRDLISRSAK